LEKIMKSKTNKASLRGMAPGRALLVLFAVSLATSGFVLSANANEGKTAIITFDAPGAGTGFFQGTQGFAISPQGTITGLCIDSGNVSHGYVRARDGTFVTFNAPGAGTGSGQGTLAFSISPNGTITGYYFDSGSVVHGYVRARDGTFTTFDVPGTGTGAFQGTFPGNINPAGVIAGNYVDASNVFHGFVRAPHRGASTPGPLATEAVQVPVRRCSSVVSLLSGLPRASKARPAVGPHVFVR
jgi:hypothetical protein